MTILITLVRKNFAVRHRPCCGFAVVFTTVVLAVFAVMEVDAGAATSSTSLATIDTPPRGSDVQRLRNDSRVVVIGHDDYQPDSLTATKVAAVPAGAEIGSIIPNRYIVTVSTNKQPDSFARGAGVVPLAVFTHALNGFTTELTPSQAVALADNPWVTGVEPDRVIGIDATQSSATWGLDRIDQRNLPLNSQYTYAASGEGVTVYIIDTGIAYDHVDFGSRVLAGATAINDGLGSFDCNGHGTHVAGTVGGATYGVAKSVTLYPIRVLNCSGSGSTSNIIAAVDWVTTQHTPNTPAVANMSLGGAASASLDLAVANSVADGVTYVVAAGNDNLDACSYSPAREPSAITVGATDNRDYRSSFSNYGACLDIFAPGTDIASDWWTSTSATSTISGTSMAAPHVAGAAALLLSADPTATPATIRTRMLANSTGSVVLDPQAGSPNVLLTTITTPGIPTGVVGTSGANAQSVVSWSAPADTGGATITGYAITASPGDRSCSWTSGALSCTVTGLTNGTAYTFSVTATNAAGTSSASSASSAVTASKVVSVKKGKTVSVLSALETLGTTVVLKSKIVTTVSAASKQICSVSSSGVVKGIKPGKCSLTVKITPPATKKVKKPKTTTTKISITIT